MRLAVIGDPVAHSLSPAIHTAALDALGIDGTYTAIRVAPADVPDFVTRLRAGSLDGVNVTMPHKKTVASLVDEMSPDAARASSVNTVVVREGRLLGHSTDVTALRRLWRTQALPSDRPVLVLGAGGAAAASVLAAPASTVYVAARRVEAAKELAALVDREVVVLPWEVAVADAVLVNATTLGMHGERLPRPTLDVAAALVDMPYGSQETPAVGVARHHGLPVVDGLDILVAQAGDSFRLWTGQEPPWAIMREAAETAQAAATGNRIMVDDEGL